MKWRGLILGFCLVVSFSGLGPFPASFCLFNTVDSKHSIYILPMAGFKLRPSGVGSNHPTNWAKTTARYLSVLLKQENVFANCQFSWNLDSTYLCIAKSNEFNSKNIAKYCGYRKHFETVYFNRASRIILSSLSKATQDHCTKYCQWVD